SRTETGGTDTSESRPARAGRAASARDGRGSVRALGRTRRETGARPQDRARRSAGGRLAPRRLQRDGCGSTVVVRGTGRDDASRLLDAQPADGPILELSRTSPDLVGPCSVDGRLAVLLITLGIGALQKLLGDANSFLDRELHCLAQDFHR